MTPTAREVQDEQGAHINAIYRGTSGQTTGKRVVEQSASRGKSRPRTRSVLEIPAPCDWITSNQRLHWRAEAKLKAAWREAGRLAVEAEHDRFDEQVRIVATICKPRGGRWDPNNWAPTTKAIVDGLVDAGLLVDDDHSRVLGPDHRAGEPGPERVVLSIESVRDSA